MLDHGANRIATAKREKDSTGYKVHKQPDQAESCSSTAARGANRTATAPSRAYVKEMSPGTNFQDIKMK